MAWTGNTDEDRLKAEAHRIEGHTTGSNARAIVKEAPKAANDTHWHVTFSGLPTDKGFPVSLDIAGKNVFKSAADGSDVNTTIDVDLAGYGTINDFHLEIPVMDFKTDRKFDMKEGNHVRFQFTDKGLAIGQQTKPF